MQQHLLVKIHDRLDVNSKQILLQWHHLQSPFDQEQNQKCLELILNRIAVAIDQGAIEIKKKREI